MIKLTEKYRQKQDIYVNPDHICAVRTGFDKYTEGKTVIILSNKSEIIIKESVEEVVRLIKEYRND